MGYEGGMRGLEKNYESVIVELLSFQRGVAQQGGVLKSLRCYLGEDSEFFLLFIVALLFLYFLCPSTRFLSFFLYFVILRLSPSILVPTRLVSFEMD